MHIESLRLAIFNYLLAKQRNEPFLVRIQDTDKARNIEGKDTEFMQILEKFAIVHDQVYHQSEHLHLHQTLAIRLLEEEKAFVCTCTPEQVEADRAEAKKRNIPYRYSGRCLQKAKSDYATLKESGDPFVIRIHKPQQPITFTDFLQGDVTIPSDEIDHFVILDTDASPTAEFATACDDMLSNISLIIEQEEEMIQTARTIHVKTLLGYSGQTEYIHLPAILNASGRKMGENDEGYWVKWLFEQGFIPDAIINYLILLGYINPPQEIFYFPEALSWFTPAALSPTPATFEMEKLRFINREHLRRMDDKRVSALFGFADADIGKLAKLYLEEASTINELAARIKPILAPKPFDGPWEKQMRQIQHVLVDAPMFGTFDALRKYVQEETGLEGDALTKPLRLLLTGVSKGPELSKIYPYIKSYLLEVIS
jgi:glutamyl-tRNA synthetase